MWMLTFSSTVSSMLSARPDILQGEGDGPLIDKLLREMLRSKNQSVSGVKKTLDFQKYVKY